MKKEILRGESTARSARKPAGAMFINSQQVADTLQCGHCGRHFMVRSDQERGWCMNCARVTCGAAKCLVCLPFELWLDAMEASGRQPIKIITGYDSFNQVQFQLRVPVSKRKLKLPAHFNKKAVRIEEEVMTVNEANLQGIL